MCNVLNCSIVHCDCYSGIPTGEAIVICTIIICVTILMYKILLMVRDWVDDIISFSNNKEIFRMVIGLFFVSVFIILITILCCGVCDILS